MDCSNAGYGGAEDSSAGGEEHIEVEGKGGVLWDCMLQRSEAKRCML